MKLEAKKELLKYKILNERYFRDVLTYALLRYPYFDNVINQISEISLSTKIVVESDKIQANQFLDLLELFIKTIKEKFFNVSYIETLICRIIQNNNDMMEDYLTSNYKVNDESTIHLLEDKIYKIIINNFITNEKYVPMVFLLLTENNIDIKPINEYTYKESSKIINILSDIVFSQRGRGKYHYLFENIENNLTYNIIQRKNRNKKFDETKYKQEFISRYVSIYESILKSYNNKLKYLKHFK